VDAAAMTTADDAIRAQLTEAIALITPYARSVGRFTNPTDLRLAIRLAAHKLESALLETTRLGTP
jgi:hypothetical protein